MRRCQAAPRVRSDARVPYGAIVSRPHVAGQSRAVGGPPRRRSGRSLASLAIPQEQDRWRFRDYAVPAGSGRPGRSASRWRGNHVWRQKEVRSFLATDERIVRPANYPAGSAGGRAYMTDVGMTGPLESVIWVRTEIIVKRFLTELPAQFEVVL